MKKFRSTKLAILLLFVFAVGCKTMKDKTPARIGIQPLPSYTFTGNIPSDTVYKIVRSNEEFNASFSASSNDTKRPDFNGQTVVAIILKEKPEHHALQFEKAEISGKTMNVYARSCNIQDSTTCKLSQVVLAATPRSAIKKVQFFVNDISRTTIDL